MSILNIHKNNGIGIGTSAVQGSRLNFNEVIVTGMPETGLNVRNGPATSYDIIGTAHNGDVFSVIELSLDNWFHIQYTDLEDGWVSGDGVEYNTCNTPCLSINENWIINGLYPIGSIYLTTSSINPSNYFGGVWEPWGSGRVPVGVNADDTSFNTVEKTGGAKTVTLTTSQMPPHRHKVRVASSSGSYSSGSSFTYTTSKYSFGGSGLTGFTGGSGGDSEAQEGTTQAHNNLQPYITCYMWKRVG